MYLLLTSPGYSQNIPSTSFHYKGFSRGPTRHLHICLVLYPDTFPCPVSKPTTSSYTTQNISTYDLQWFLSMEASLPDIHVINILKST